MKRFGRVLAVLLAVSTLIGCTKPSDSGVITATETSITIKNNGGGTIAAFIKERSRLKVSGKKIILEGYCASACTIFYSLPNACMAKGSYLAFHGADSPIGFTENWASGQMSKFYRAGIKEGFEREWKYVTKPLHRVSRAEAKRLDPEIKFCETQP